MHLSYTFQNVRFTGQTISEGRSLLYELLPDDGQGRMGDRFAVVNDQGSWSLDDFEEWLAEYDASDGSASIALYTSMSDGFSLSWNPWDQSTTVEVTAGTRATVSRLMRHFRDVAPTAQLPTPPEPPVEPAPRPRVFIGHGRSPDWRDLKDALLDKHGYPVEAYETGARAGHAIRDVLDDMLTGSDFALIVLTCEDETSDGQMRARQNVVHEAGLFQGRLGFNRAIAVVEEGAELFSNLDGIQQLRYPQGQIMAVMSDVLATIKREFPDHG